MMSHVFSADTHPDAEINQMFIQLLDALCMWERATGRRNVLVYHERNVTIRAIDGKPNIPPDITDTYILSGFNSPPPPDDI